MKRIWVLAFILSLCFTGCINFNPKEQDVKNKEEEIVVDSQDDMVMEKSNHLKFKGVPIDGKLENFVSRMKRKGFQHIATQDEVEILQGDFADFKKCTIYVTALNNKDLVSNISVAFPEQEQWVYLYGDYKHLKELLTEKYGNPSACTEEFQGSFEPRKEGDKMLKVKFDGCKYETRFTMNNGEIVLWIEHEGMSSCFVMLSYNDKANENVIREHAKADL